jgi:tetratricopeptide (TPR) repeat protein
MKPRPPQRPDPCCPQIVYCGSPGDKDAARADKDDRTAKVIEQVLTSVKENTERAIDAAKTSNETVKWVYIVQSALATFVGIVLASIGGALGYFGFRSLKDFRRFQVRARQQRELIRRRFLEESKKMEYWGELNTQFAAASAPLATLGSIHDEEIREEMLRVTTGVARDELARAQRESRKLQALENAMRAIRRLKELATKAEHARFLSWAEGAEATANFNAGNLDAALQLAMRAKEDNPMNHPDRAYVLGFVYARMYYERKDATLKEAAIREFREAFSRDASGAFTALAQGDKELELYLGKETVTRVTRATQPPTPSG